MQEIKAGQRGRAEKQAEKQDQAKRSTAAEQQRAKRRQGNQPGKEIGKATQQSKYAI